MIDKDQPSESRFNEDLVSPPVEGKQHAEIVFDLEAVKRAPLLERDEMHKKALREIIENEETLSQIGAHAAEPIVRDKKGNPLRH